MRHYLSNIHTKSDTHKKRFALAVSGSVTLIIFVIWSAVVFQPKEGVVAKTNELQLAGAAAALPEEGESPFKNLSEGLNQAVNTLKDGVNQTKETIQSVDVNSEYQQIRNETYGN